MGAFVIVDIVVMVPRRHPSPPIVVSLSLSTSDPPCEQGLATVVAGADHWPSCSSCCPSPAALALPVVIVRFVPSHRCCQELILVPKNFVSKKRMKREKKQKLTCGPRDVDDVSWAFLRLACFLVIPSCHFVIPSCGRFVVLSCGHFIVLSCGRLVVLVGWWHCRSLALL
jgi:hypothetical protein